MWQLLGTLAVSAFGGTLLIHFLKNFLLTEKGQLAWDWDGIIERALIAYLVAAGSWLFLIPVIILIKVVFRLATIGLIANFLSVEEPGVVSQRVKLKSELALDLIISPLFAILVGVIF